MGDDPSSDAQVAEPNAGPMSRALETQDVHGEANPRYFAWDLAEHGERPCVGDARIQLSYAQFAAVVDGCALLLRSVGVSNGDVVALQIPNRVEFLVAMMATWRLGAIATPVNPEFGAAEIGHQLDDSGARVVITDRPEAAAGRNVTVIRIHEIANPDGRFIADSSWSASLTSAPTAKDIALLIYTSGTTGAPKGVALAHNNLQVMASSMVTHLELTGDDHCLLVLPLFHVNAICTSFLTPMLAGGRLTIIGRFSVSDFSRAVCELQPTYFSGVPMIYALIARQSDVDRTAFSSLRFAISGAAPISPSILAAAEELLGVPVVEGYGLTEGTCASTCNPVVGQRKPGTVGPAMPGQTIAVVGPQGPTTEPGIAGEVVIRGGTVMAGYHNKPEETAATIIDGWLYTGDVGTLDAEGYLSIVDRKKDMIIRGGENVYPKQIECVLAEHPAVFEVAVVGRPDDVAGETPHAFVVTRPGSATSESELVAFLAERVIRAKVPTAIEFVDALPRNPIGKTDKVALRQLCRRS
jgi:long-chain acyl-CoA synthetase